MNRNICSTSCERASEVVKAERAGEWTPELQGHAESCAECAETVRIAQALAGSAERARGLHAMPSAGQVWFKAQKRAREAAIRRATRWVRVMPWLGGAYALALAAWGVRSLAGGELEALLPVFKSAGGGFALLSGLGAVACMALGMLIFAKDDRRGQGLGR